MFTNVYLLNLQAGRASVSITTANPTIAGNASGAASAAASITTANPTVAGSASGAATAAVAIALPRPTVSISATSVATAAASITTTQPTIAAALVGDVFVAIAITTTNPTIAGNASGAATIGGAITTTNPTIAGNASGAATAAVAITLPRPTISSDVISGGDVTISITTARPTIAATASGLSRVNISGQNLIPFSENFDVLWTHTSITLVPNDIAAPDGSMTATRLTYTAGGALNGIVQTWSGTGSSTGMTFSVYVKQGSGAADCNAFYLRNNTTAVNVATGSINFSTGVVTGTGITSFDVGGGWYRVVLSSLAFSNGDGVRTYICADSTVTIGNYAYAWGAQLTKGIGQAIYVPTAGAAVSTPILTTMAPTVAANASSLATSTIAITTSNPTILLGAIGRAVANVSVTTQKPTIAAAIAIAQLVSLPLTAPKPTVAANASGIARVDISGENLLPYSQDFSTSVWTRSTSTLGANVTTAPDGTLTASSITYTVTGINNGFLQNVAGAGSSTGNTFSVYAKKGSGATDCNVFYLRNNTTAVTLATGTLNYDTGVITGVGASVRSVGNGWYRVTLSHAAFNNGDVVRPYVAADASGAIGNYAYIWGAQVTTGIGERPYIKTDAIPLRFTPILTAPKPVIAASATASATVDIPFTTRRPTISVGISEVLAINIPFTTRRPTISGVIDIAETLNIHLTTTNPVVAAITEDKTIFIPVLTPQPLTYKSGYPLQIDLTIRDSRGNPINLSGSTYSAKMSSSSLSTTTITLSTTIINAAAGQIRLGASTQTMSTLKEGRYEFSLMQTTAQNIKNKLAHGIMVTSGPFVFVPTTQYRHYGVASASTTKNANLILGLPTTGTLGVLVDTFTLTSIGSDTMFYAYPSSYGLAYFENMDALDFPGGWDAATGNIFTGASGPLTVPVNIDGTLVDYYLYQTDFAGLGAMNWRVTHTA